MSIDACRTISRRAGRRPANIPRLAAVGLQRIATWTAAGQPTTMSPMSINVIPEFEVSGVPTQESAERLTAALAQVLADFQRWLAAPPSPCGR